MRYDFDCDGHEIEHLVGDTPNLLGLAEEVKTDDLRRICLYNANLL